MIAFVIPLVGGSVGDLWLAVAWSTGADALALGGVLRATGAPSPHLAPHWMGPLAWCARASGFVALVLAMLKLLARVAWWPGPVIAFLGLARGGAWLLTAAAFLWFMSTTVRKFDAQRLARALSIAALAVGAYWLVFHVGRLLAHMAVPKDRWLEMAFSLGSAGVGVLVLLFSVLCLLRTAARLPSLVIGRCVRCGYIVLEAERCPECGTLQARLAVGSD